MPRSVVVMKKYITAGSSSASGVAADTTNFGGMLSIADITVQKALDTLDDHNHDHGVITGLADDDHTQYLLADGTRELSADWDAGSFEIRAKTFESDVAAGTAPFTIASTTVSTNLNADLWDGYEFADYIDQAVKQASSPTFVTMKLSGLTDGYVPYHVADATGLANSAIFQDASSNVGIHCTPNAKLEIEDGGTAMSMVVKITQDDATLYGLIIGNDTYSTTDTLGLQFYVNNTGSGYVQNGGAGDLLLAAYGTANVSNVILYTENSVVFSDYNEGAPATALTITPNSATVLTVGGGAAGVDYILKFDGETNDGILTWMEDEDYFKFGDDVMIPTGENIYLVDTSTYIRHDGTNLILADDTKINLFSNAITFGTTVDSDITLTFQANSNSGVFAWMEDEDYFKFDDDLFIYDSKHIYFRSSQSFIYSEDVGIITLVGGTSVDLVTNALTIGKNTDEDISITFNAASNNGTITWMEDEAVWAFSNTASFANLTDSYVPYHVSDAAGLANSPISIDPPSWIHIGVDDTTYGAIALYGQATGSSTGGWLALFTSADYDTAISYFEVRVVEDDLLIGTNVTENALALTSDLDFYITAGDVYVYGRTANALTIGNGAAGVDYALTFNGETNDGTITWMEDENWFKLNRPIRMATSLYRRYYHMPITSVAPGASGATWVDPGANSTGGWQLNAVGEIIVGQADVHSDWDGASDLQIEVRFYVNVDNSGGGAGDTVDLKGVIRYKGTGDTAVKSQTVEVATVVGASAQYKAFVALFTIDWDYADNVVEAGDNLSVVLNLETDTSEVDDVVITGLSFSYLTTHTGIENGDE